MTTRRPRMPVGIDLDADRSETRPVNGQRHEPGRESRSGSAVEDDSAGAGSVPCVDGPAPPAPDAVADAVPVEKRAGVAAVTAAARKRRGMRTSLERNRRKPVMGSTMARELLRREEVEERFGVSRSWIYSQMRAGRFPEPVKIGVRAVRWRVRDLDKWAADRPVAHGEIGCR